MPQPTNTYRLYQFLAAEPEGVQAFYFSGVGVSDGQGPGFGTTLQRVLGGAFGFGIDTDIKQVYRRICQTYQPGDRLFFFGSDRGAYTVRSVVGMIRKAGLLRDPSDALVEEAFALHRKR